MLSDKYSFDKNCFKYFADYKNYNDSMTSLVIKLPNLNGYIKSFGEAKHIIFKLEEKHENILEQYSKIWNKVK